MPKLYQERYKLLTEMCKENIKGNPRDHSKYSYMEQRERYLMMLVEHEMETLLNEFRGPDEPYRHWYFWNKSYKHFKKVHVL